MLKTLISRSFSLGIVLEVIALGFTVHLTSEIDEKVKRCVVHLIIAASFWVEIVGR